MTSRDVGKNISEDGTILESVGVRSRPTWIRGEAFIDGDEIVLVESAAEHYSAFDPEHSLRLLLDLGNLAKIGQIVKREKTLGCQVTDARRAVEFSKNHGFLWHGPRQLGSGVFRENLEKWCIAGIELTVTTAMYSKIKEGLEEPVPSAEPIRRYLRMWRDTGLFKHISLPDDDNELLEYACIQLAERISRGMAECTPTFSAACGLLKDGIKVGGAGDFRFGNDPGSLLGAANYQLASLVSRKKLVRECEECKEMFIPEDPRRRYHPKCGARKRQRERRQRRKVESSHE